MPIFARRANHTPNIHAPRTGVRLAGVVCLCLALGGGCRNAGTGGQEADHRPLQEYAAEGRQVFSENPAPTAVADSGSPPAEVAPPDAGRWIIALSTVPGDTRVIGEQMLATTRTEGGLPEAYLAQRGGKLIVAVGSYADPSSPEAQRELERVRRVEVRGGRPYAMAFLSPPDAGGGGNPAHDLRRARELFGPKALYTLQVAVYGHPDGHTPTPDELKLFRETAEKAVAQLRAEGELAFYYHDRTRSSVTVGIFGEEDHDASVRPPFESVRLEQTRERHPNNLLNGQGIREIVRGTDGQRRETIQKSFLVAVPG